MIVHGHTVVRLQGFDFSLFKHKAIPFPVDSINN